MKTFDVFLTEMYNDLQAAFSKAAFAVMNQTELEPWYSEDELLKALFKDDRMDPFLPRIAF